MSNTDRKAVNIEFPADLAWKAKADAARRRVSFSAWMREAARAKLAMATPCDKESASAVE